MDGIISICPCWRWANALDSVSNYRLCRSWERYSRSTRATRSVANKGVFDEHSSRSFCFDETHRNEYCTLAGRSSIRRSLPVILNRMRKHQTTETGSKIGSKIVKLHVVIQKSFMPSYCSNVLLLKDVCTRIFVNIFST